MKRKPYTIRYTPEADGDIATLEAGQRALVLRRIPIQLEHQPTVQTLNRKRMDPDKRFFIAPWELRVGDLRVYYAVEEEPERVVAIVGVAVKDGDRVKFRGNYLEP